jgi:predicted Zn-dependent protease with MMP-like domain
VNWRFRVTLASVPSLLTAADFDEVVAETLDELPVWVLDRLGDVIVRVEMRPRPSLTSRPGAAAATDVRLVLYREPILGRARNRRELRRLVRADLVRRVVGHLALDGPRAADLATSLY